MTLEATRFLLAMGAFALADAAMGAAPTSSIEGWYTADQATAGRTKYNANCAACHGQNLQGGAGPAPVSYTHLTLPTTPYV